MQHTFLTRRHLLALAGAATLGGCDKLGLGGPPQPAFKGLNITGADYARRLSLPDPNGQPRTLADFKGKVTVVFFGYTQCPDVCPTTLMELATVKRDLGAQGALVQPVFVTVDPERDTRELLKAYMANFGPDFLGLSGDAAQTQAVAKEFKIYYAKVPSKTSGNYTVDHTAGSYLFDKQGQVRVFSRYGSGAEALAHDLKLLLAEP